MKLNIRTKHMKNQMVLTAGLWTYMILLVMRIPLSRVVGDAGMGLLAPAFELYWLVTLFTSYGMGRAMSGAIRYRIKREQYKNAGKVLKAAFIINMVVSVVIAVVLGLLARVMADVLFLESLSRMAILVTAPVIIFSALIGTFRGYFGGYGLGVLVAHSQYLEKITMLICALICGNIFNNYGEKVSLLLKADQYAYAYGAMGVMVGVLLSQMITILYLLVVFVIYSTTLKGKLGQDNSRKPETQYSLQRLLLNNSIPLALIVIMSNVLILIDQRMFNYCMNVQEMGEMRTALWGSYYSKFAVLIGIGAVFVCLSVYAMAGKISNAYEREEYRAMREWIGRAVRKICMIAFPIAIYLAVLSDAVVKCLYKGMTDETIAWLQKGTVLIVLYGLGFLFGQVLYKLHMVRELMITVGISVLVHVVSAYLMIQKGLLGADGVIYSLILFFLLETVLCFLLVSRRLKYRQAWLTDVAFPAVAACVSGLVVLLLNKLLLGSVGALVTILIACLVGVFLYVMLLMVLKVIGEAELSRMPLGFFFLMLGRNMGIL
ncbi:MAG: polysaccharide biosynthesis C-terminal domain-containing protein [Lachnospiraceae bacterium]